METLILGLVGIVVGLLVAAFGVRAFFVLLPLWGFVTGFMLGGDAVASLFGEGFLVTVLGWGAAIGLGVLLALLTTLLWRAAIIILAGGVGYVLGSGVVVALGLDPGFLSLAAGLVLGVVFAVGAIALDAPIMLVAVLTSIGGAAYAATGLFMILGQISIRALDHGGPVGALAGHPLAIVVWLVLGGCALGYQLIQVRRLQLEKIDREDYRFG